MKTTKKLLSVLVALVLVVSMSSVVARADDETPTTSAASSLDSAYLTKDLEVADGIDISAVNTFTFSFTAVGSNTAAVADHPAIAEQSVTVGTQSGGHAYGAKAMSAVFTLGSFTHAGEYVYTVKETTAASTTTADGVTKTLTVDDTEYTVHVFVKNGTNGLEFDGIIVETGAGEDTEKVDPTYKDEDAKTTGFNFENSYKEDIADPTKAALTVTKSITGAYGDKSKTFPITVTLVIPSTATAADVELASSSAGTLNGLTVTADLADGGAIIFSKLPAGTTFTVSEDQDDAYKSKITGFVATPDTDYVEGDREDIAGQTVVAAGNEVSIENNREDVIPTGVLINNLPYVVLVLVAMMGVAYISLKKRARNF